MKEVFCIGELLIDFVDEGHVGNLARVETFSKKPGGAPANVAAAVARLGGKGYFVGAVGRDAFGDYLVSVLEENGVSAELTERSDKFTTLAFVSLEKSGEGGFDFSRGADEDLSYKSDLKERFKNNLVHFGSATGLLGGQLEETYAQYLADAVEKRAFISFDPNFRDALWEGGEEVFKEKCRPFLQQSHLAKFSLEEAQLLSGEADLKKACDHFHQMGISVAVVTLGEKGTYVSSANIAEIVPSIAVKAVDTTGAGDAFIGALLQQIAEEEDPFSVLNEKERLIDMIKNANKAGAITTTNFGAITALPGREEVFGV